MENSNLLLSHLKPGDTAVICGYETQSMLVNRLRELGLVRGVCLRVKRTAPFGDPIEITVKGYNLSLRKKDAEEIRVIKQ